MWVFFGIKTKHMIPCSSDWFISQFSYFECYQIDFSLGFFWFFLLKETRTTQQLQTWPEKLSIYKLGH